MVVSILCYMPLSVELLDSQAPDFKPGSATPKFSNQIDTADKYIYPIAFYYVI